MLGICFFITEGEIGLRQSFATLNTYHFHIFTPRICHPRKECMGREVSGNRRAFERRATLKTHAMTYRQDVNAQSGAKDVHYWVDDVTGDVAFLVRGCIYIAAHKVSTGEIGIFTRRVWLSWKSPDSDATPKGSRRTKCITMPSDRKSDERVV